MFFLIFQRRNGKETNFTGKKSTLNFGNGVEKNRMYAKRPCLQGMYRFQCEIYEDQTPVEMEPLRSPGCEAKEEKAEEDNQIKPP